MIYVIRPDRTPLWMPDYLAKQLGIQYGDQLTHEQYASPPIQSLITDRLKAEKGKRK